MNHNVNSGTESGRNTILVVDDEPDLQMLILQMFRKYIKEGIYEFCFAEDGEQALDVIGQRDDIKMILCDIRMPNMDGLQLLNELNSLEQNFFKTVMVSAFGDMANIRQAMNRGAFDFINKPVDFEDLRITIEKTINEVDRLLEAQREKSRLDAYEEDLNTASRIQQKILPDFPAYPERDDFEIFGGMITAKQVGGDFYDYFFIDEDNLAFLIGDVSGKGMPAALYMAVARTMLKTRALDLPYPGECLNQVNSMLIPESDETTFVTVFLCLLDTRTGTVRYSNGGHELPYLIRNNGEVGKIEDTSGLLLGKIEPVPFETKELQLAEGDSLLLYTDGVTECVNEDDEFYEEQRLEAYLRQNAGKNIQPLINGEMADLLKYMGKADQFDDITMIGITWKNKDDETQE